MQLSTHSTSRKHLTLNESSDSDWPESSKDLLIHSCDISDKLSFAKCLAVFMVKTSGPLAVLRTAASSFCAGFSSAGPIVELSHLWPTLALGDQIEPAAHRVTPE